MFRERRLRRDDLLATADTAVFANVALKWDTAENILVPGPYRSETVKLDPDSVRRFPFEPRAVSVVAEYTGPQAELLPRTVLRRQIEKLGALGYTVEAAFEFEFIVLAETADSLRAKGFANPGLFAADNRCWSGQTAATFAPFVADLESILASADVDLFSLSVELGPGCFEATLRHKPGHARRRRCRLLPHVHQGVLPPARPDGVFHGAARHGLSRHRRPCRRLAQGQEGQECLRRCQGRERLVGDRQVLPRRHDRGRARSLPALRAHRQRLPPPGSRKLGAEGDGLGALQLCRRRPHRRRDAETRRAWNSACPAATAIRICRWPSCWPPASTASSASSPSRTSRSSAAARPKFRKACRGCRADLLEATKRMRESKKARAWLGDAFVDHFAMVCEAEHAALARAVSAEEVRRYLEGG